MSEMKKRGVDYDPKRASSASIQSDGVDRNFKQRCLATMADFDPRAIRLVESVDEDCFTEHGLFKRDISLLSENVSPPA